MSVRIVVSVLLLVLAQAANAGVVTSIDFTTAVLTNDAGSFTSITSNTLSFASNDNDNSGTNDNLYWSDYPIPLSGTFIVFEAETIWSGSNRNLGSFGVYAGGANGTNNGQEIQGVDFDGTLAFSLAPLDRSVPLRLSIIFHGWETGEFSGSISNLRVIDDTTVPTEWLAHPLNEYRDQTASPIPAPNIAALLTLSLASLCAGYRRLSQGAGLLSSLDRERCFP